MVASAAAVLSAPGAAAQQDRYSDVTGGVHKPAIDALGGTGLFDGTLCDDSRFCPTKPIERSTMAVWLIRALTDADPPPVQDSRFADVPAGRWWAGHVELLAQLGITAGCRTNPLRYCPDRSVTRAEMATFLTRAFNLEPGPPAGFADVDEDSSHVAGINAIAAAGITAGCGTDPPRYCPERPVTRAEMATFLASAFVPTIDLTGITPVVTVDVGDKRPTVGDPTGIAVAVTDIDGTPLPGARLELVVDGELRDIAVADGDGRATFTLNRPTGPANEGGYDSIQVQVATTDVVSRPTGVFWQPAESRRITISVSPDSSHSGKARTITAQVVEGTTPMAGRPVELHIDGTLLGRAPTGDDGTTTFTLRKQVEGPFDLAKVVLAEDRSVASNEVLISWPLSTRGVHGSNDWEIVWRDEFGGTSLDASKWRAINNCPPVYLACDTDRPENVYVSGGMLHLRSLREPYAGVNKWKGSGSQFGPLTSYTEGEFFRRDFTAGRVDSTRDFTHGRFEMLGKLPQGHGTFFAFWMRPRDSPYGNDAAGGEIDIAEGANIGRGGNRRGQIGRPTAGRRVGRPSSRPYGIPPLQPARTNRPSSQPGRVVPPVRGRVGHRLDPLLRGRQAGPDRAAERLVLTARGRRAGGQAVRTVRSAVLHRHQQHRRRLGPPIRRQPGPRHHRVPNRVRGGLHQGSTSAVHRRAPAFPDPGRAARHPERAPVAGMVGPRRIL